MPIGRTMARACAAIACTTVAAAVAAVPPAYAVEEAADAARAELRGLAVSPAEVDVSVAPATVGVAAHVVSPYRATAVRISLGGAAPVPLQLTAGTTADGTWSAAVPVAAFTPHGAVPARVDVTDATGAVMTVSRAAALTAVNAVPAVPARIAASAVPGQSADLRVEWAAPAANGAGPVTAYDVTATPVTGTAVVPAAVTAAADAQSVTFTGLSVATRYVFRVAARNAVGTGPAAVADATTPVPGVTVPDGPTSVVAAPRSGAVDVTWTPPVSDGGSPLTGYDVQAVPWGDAPAPPVVTVAPGVAGAALTGLRNGAAYDVTVTARNAVGAGLAATTRAVPRGVPAAPVIGTVTAGDASAVVRWNPPGSTGGAPVQSYAVVASSGRVVTVPASARSVRVLRLRNGTAVTFTVHAVNAAGTGRASAARTVTPRKAARLLVSSLPATPVVYGTPSVVGARLVDAGGRALSGQRVELRAQVRPSTTWRTVAAATTSSTGGVSLRATFAATAALRLYHAPTAYAAPVLSVRGVGVAPKLTAAPSSVKLRAGQALTVTGGVAPAHPAGSSVRLQRYVSGEWRTVAYGSMTTTTAYRVSWKPGASGSWTMRVVKPADADHVTGRSPRWTQQVTLDSAADIARAIRYDSSISLERVHQSGVNDLATAYQNIVDVSNGLPARRSAYQNAPGGYTSLDLRLLKALRYMGTLGSVTVSEIAGGSHAVGSSHYYGRGLDINYVNGRHVGPGSGYQMAIDACRAYGASRVFSPGYDPYGGHQGHVHCEWS